MLVSVGGYSGCDCSNLSDCTVSPIQRCQGKMTYRRGHRMGNLRSLKVAIQLLVLASRMVSVCGVHMCEYGCRCVHVCVVCAYECECVYVCGCAYVCVVCACVLWVWSTYRLSMGPVSSQQARSDITGSTCCSSVLKMSVRSPPQSCSIRIASRESGCGVVWCLAMCSSECVTVITSNSITVVVEEEEVVEGYVNWRVMVTLVHNYLCLHREAGRGIETNPERSLLTLHLR